MKIKQLIITACIATLLIAMPAQAGEIQDAAQSGDEAKITKLLKAGIDINTDGGDDTPLYTAVMYEKIDMVKFLIKKGANVSQRVQRGYTPLCSAAENNNTAIAKLLLDNGADVNGANKWGDTPLVVAAQAGSVDTAKLLLAKGANIEAKDDKGWTVLSIAAQKGDIKMANLLLDKGANVNAKNNREKNFVPLFKAVIGGNTEVVALMIAKGAKVNTKNDDGNTPLHYAAAQGNKAIVKLLLDKGADANIKNNNDQAPVVFAENDEIKQLLQASSENTKTTTHNADVVNSKGAEYLSAGFEAYQAGKVDTAIDYFTKGIKADPNIYELYAMRGIAYMDKEDYARTIPDCDKVIEMKPDNTNIVSRMYYNRAYSNIMQKKLDGVVDDLISAITNNPYNYPAYDILAMVSGSMGKYDVAVKVAQMKSNAAKKEGNDKEFNDATKQILEYQQKQQESNK